VPIIDLASVRIRPYAVRCAEPEHVGGIQLSGPIIIIEIDQIVRPAVEGEPPLVVAVIANVHFRLIKSGNEPLATLGSDDPEGNGPLLEEASGFSRRHVHTRNCREKRKKVTGREPHGASAIRLVVPDMIQTR
jgi:hypothetical protein